MSIIRIGIYLGVGAILHVIFVGSQFDWSSAWTWLWLLGWPVMLILTLWIVVLVGIVVGLIIVGIMALAGKL